MKAKGASIYVRPRAPTISVSSLDEPAPLRFKYHDGEKFPGGFGPTELLLADYWTLRARSSQLFEQNLYARGLIRRLVDNEINTGLHLEALPDEGMLGYPEDGLAEWSESVENRFSLWGQSARLCDQAEQRTFGGLQATARREALIAGDVLVVLVQDPKTQLPRVQLINGSSVQTPMQGLALGALPNGNRVVHGVEIDAQGRQVAYWIVKPGADALSTTTERLPAYGEKTGRRTAWLLYGTDKRLDDVRGKPLLALVLQSLREIDRYRDAVQRKAVINAMIAMFIKKGEDKPGTKPMTGGAVRRGTDTTTDTTGKRRSFNVAEHIPGLVLDELQHGEEPEGFTPNGTDEKFADFEEAIVCTVAWANGVPPEILRLSFSSNYSASQAAINEFKIYLNIVRADFGDGFCQPIYADWLLSLALAGRIDAPRLLEAWRDPALYEVFGSWVAADWTGHIKPAVDLSKLVRGYTELIAQGLITRDRASRELTGTKYSKNVQKLARENEQLAVALKPITPAPPVVPAAKGDDGEGEDKGEDDDDEGGDKVVPLKKNKKANK